MHARSHPLGVHPSAAGDGSANVAVYAPGVEELDLVYRRPGGRWCRQRLEGREHGIHVTTLPPPAAPGTDTPQPPGTDPTHGVCAAMPAGTQYVFAAADPEVRTMPDPASEQLLLDPYGRGLARLSPPGGVEDPGPDAYGGVYVSEIAAQDFDWQGVSRPPTPWRDTIVYEAHVKGLTRLHPEIPEDQRGTYAGLAHPVIIDHLRELGVTAVQLLPVHAHLDEPHLTAAGLSNYWGYNTLSFFTPHAAYATRAAQQSGATAVLNEFKSAVAALHAAGIQVFLDVVYNHTAEGGQNEPAYCWRGLGEREYYRHDDHGNYVDVTGCGNSVNFGNPQVVRMALDSLRYWVQECHVDGFRFDLAPVLGRDEHHHFTRNHPFFVAVAADPVLQDVRMISEPWDVGTGGWQTGNFPHGWADWNDTYRDTVRDFWLAGQRTMGHGGGGGTSGALASGLAGSAEIFAPGGRSTLAGVNFVTAHDGFTLHDLTTYDRKHNEANGEDNGDGTNDNHSWNHGEEGPSHDVRRRAARAKTARNMMATLLLSQGIPMITAGDELLRTQHGNNNAYCQDNELSWLDWNMAPLQRSMLRATSRLVRLRRRFLAGQPGVFPVRSDEVLLHWYAPDGSPMTPQEWQTDGARTIQVVLGSCGGSLAGMFVINGAAQEVAITLPGPEEIWSLAACATGHPVVNGTFDLVFATDSEMAEGVGRRFSRGDPCVVPAQTVALFTLD